jgi:hypothetical protein
MAIRYRANAIYNGKQDFDWKQVKASLTDYKLYLNGFAQFSMNTASFGYSNFLPTIIKGTPSLLLFDVRGCLLTRAVVCDRFRLQHSAHAAHHRPHLLLGRRFLLDVSASTLSCYYTFD